MYCDTVLHTSMFVTVYSGDSVETLDPPAGSKPGDRVSVEGFNTEGALIY